MGRRGSLDPAAKCSRRCLLVLPVTLAHRPHTCAAAKVTQRTHARLRAPEAMSTNLATAASAAIRMDCVVQYCVFRAALCTAAAGAALPPAPLLTCGGCSARGGTTAPSAAGGASSRTTCRAGSPAARQSGSSTESARDSVREHEEVRLRDRACVAVSVCGTAHMQRHAK